ncbi:MAG: hypothetical protein JWN23_3414 [Rhodocyclales bacterium]|nr:hypothetical protein [Rhodocyclales bacterium]
MFKLGLGKYRTIIVLITLFLVFDVGVLAMTFLISKQIASDAVSLNLAGQQRTLVQQLTKTALLLEQDATQGIIDSSGQSSFSELKELIGTADQFNSTLDAFHQGGRMVEGRGKVALTPQDDEQAAEQFKLLEEMWVPINVELQKIKQLKSDTKPDLGPLLQVLVADNLNLLTVSNMLTSRMESLSATKATNLRIVQVAGISLALVNFGFILYFFLRQLRTSDRAVERAQKETEDILRTTQEGLFLLDTEFRVGLQTSQALSKILGISDLAGRDFLALLKPIVTPKTFETAKEYIELLLRHDVKEKLVASLNPLDCIEVSAAQPNGAIESRFLNIRFNRVFDAGKVTHLLVTATDITRRVRLERELKESERKVQDQMGMMVHILQADPSLLQEFLRNAIKGLDQINEELRTGTATAGMSAKRIDMLFRISHRLKGDANALKLEAIAQSLHAFENLLDGLRANPSLRNEDFLPVTVRVKGLYAEIHAIQDALTRVAQVRGVVTVEPPKPAQDPAIAALPFVHQWRNFAQEIAQRHKKAAELSYQGLDLATLALPLREAINSIVNQFIRNAMTHGVESPVERKQRGKPEAGRISVYVSDAGDGYLELSFRDDGAGIDPEKIREAAVRTGRLDATAAGLADMRKLISMIFEPGVSTRETVDEDAGRGVGLDTVKDMVARMGGRVRIGTTVGEYCHFRVQLPLGGVAANASIMDTNQEAA